MSDNLNKNTYHTLWRRMIDEYFRRHPEAGLAWWQVPVEEQPEGFKLEMYDIFWRLTRNNGGIE